MSSKVHVEEALYNTLESPRHVQREGNSVVPGTLTDEDYSNIIECPYQKLNMANAVAKNTYSSLVTTSNSNKAPMPQDYLTPVITEHLKEQLSKTTSPVVVKKDKEHHTTYFWLLLLLTCISLLLAVTAIILAVVALSQASNDNDHETSLNDDYSDIVATDELKTPSETVNNSAIELLDRKLLELHNNITTQLSVLADSINDVESMDVMLNDQLETIKGNILKFNTTSNAIQRVLLMQTTSMATLGFKVQELTTQLSNLKASQQSHNITMTDNRPVKVPPISQMYTQWGKRSCSSEGVTAIYTGYAAGPGSFRPANNNGRDIAIHGGGTNMLCLTNTPSLRRSHGAPSAAATVYAAQYLNNSIRFDSAPPMPCSVCEVHNASAVLTVPGSDKCPEGWTVEYNGFIMAQSFRVGSVRNFEESEYICVDDAFDSSNISTSRLQRNGRDTATFMTTVKVDCGQGIPCGNSNYSSNLSLTCAVCSKRTS